MGRQMVILVATDREILVMDVERGAGAPANGIGGRPTCLTADPLIQARAWCGTQRDGVFRSDDGGRSWHPVGLAGRLIMAVAASPTERNVVWAGTEPSEVWRSGDAGSTWQQTSPLETLSTSSEWSFPPKPETHHVRWIACHPTESERLWVAIEAGALVSTMIAAAPGATASLVGRGTLTSWPFTATLPIRCASPLAMDISKATTPARRGGRPAPVSGWATCGVWRSILSSRPS